MNFGKYAIISAIILILYVAYSATYYVSPAGSDTSDGSFAHPWATPGFGSKNVLGGDTLVILFGEYVMTDFYDDMITPPSGSVGAPTVIIGQGATKPKMLGTGSLFSAPTEQGNSAFSIFREDCVQTESFVVK